MPNPISSSISLPTTKTLRTPRTDLPNITSSSSTPRPAKNPLSGVVSEKVQESLASAVEKMLGVRVELIDYEYVKGVVNPEEDPAKRVRDEDLALYSKALMRGISSYLTNLQEGRVKFETKIQKVMPYVRSSAMYHETSDPAQDLDAVRVQDALVVDTLNTGVSTLQRQLLPQGKEWGRMKFVDNTKRLTSKSDGTRNDEDKLMRELNSSIFKNIDKSNFSGVSVRCLYDLMLGCGCMKFSSGSTLSDTNFSFQHIPLSSLMIDADSLGVHGVSVKFWDTGGETVAGLVPYMRGGRRGVERFNSHTISNASRTEARFSGTEYTSSNNSSSNSKADTNTTSQHPKRQLLEVIMELSKYRAIVGEVLATNVAGATSGKKKPLYQRLMSVLDVNGDKTIIDKDKPTLAPSKTPTPTAEGYVKFIINTENGEIVARAFIPINPYIVFRWNPSCFDEYGNGLLCVAYDSIRARNKLLESLNIALHRSARGVFTVLKGDIEDLADGLDGINLSGSSALGVDSNANPDGRGKSIEPMAILSPSALVFEALDRHTNLIKQILFTEPLGSVNDSVRTASELGYRASEFSGRTASASSGIFKESHRALFKVALYYLTQQKQLPDGLADKMAENEIEYQNRAPHLLAQQQEERDSLMQFIMQLQSFVPAEELKSHVDFRKAVQELATLHNVQNVTLSDEDNKKEVAKQQEALAQQQAQGGSGGGSGGQGGQSQSQQQGSPPNSFSTQVNNQLVNDTANQMRNRKPI